jgi:hypothetical protein
MGVMPLAPEEYLRPEVIQQVQRLDLKARCIVEGFLSGLHRSPFHGFSVEFSEHRKYTPGDDTRLIDWSVYGKTDRYYIKKFEAETNLEGYLVMDCSGSMDYADGGRMTKDGLRDLPRGGFGIHDGPPAGPGRAVRLRREGPPRPARQGQTQPPDRRPHATGQDAAVRRDAARPGLATRWPSGSASDHSSSSSATSSAIRTP